MQLKLHLFLDKIIRTVLQELVPMCIFHALFAQEGDGVFKLCGSNQWVRKSVYKSALTISTAMQADNHEAFLHPTTDSGRWIVRVECFHQLT